MPTTRQRDNQRSKVYAWERKVVATLGGEDIYKPDFQTLQECEDFAGPIWTKERGRLGLARVVAPTIDRPSWGQRRAMAHHSHKITLPRWARSRWVILHELAHRLTPSDEAHGPRFVGVLMGLAARWLSYDVNQLMALADDMGVNYYVRSIGVVPVRGISWHVERVLLVHPPMTAMEFACHLSIAERIEATDRQVRAAALRLIREGKARWLRNKLTPLATAGMACVPA
jgi:hypothetical protein